VDSNAYVILLN